MWSTDTIKKGILVTYKMEQHIKWHMNWTEYFLI